MKSIIPKAQDQRELGCPVCKCISGYYIGSYSTPSMDIWRCDKCHTVWTGQQRNMIDRLMKEARAYRRRIKILRVDLRAALADRNAVHRDYAGLLRQMETKRNVAEGTR